MICNPIFKVGIFNLTDINAIMSNRRGQEALTTDPIPNTINHIPVVSSYIKICSSERFLLTVRFTTNKLGGPEIRS